MRIPLLLVLLAAPLAQAAPPAAAADPASLFEGRSEGRGVLTFALGRPRPYTVENLGHREADGSFRLDQVVRFEGEPARTRHWRIRPDGADRYTFTLSDAAGPGVATVDAAQLRLRYAPRHGLRQQQVLTRRSDGTIANAGRITLLGLPIAHLVETITPAAAGTP
jgi:hypothetical protein